MPLRTFPGKAWITSLGQKTAFSGRQETHRALLPSALRADLSWVKEMRHRARWQVVSPQCLPSVIDAWCQTHGRESSGVHPEEGEEGGGPGPCDRPSRSGPALPWTFSFFKDVAVAKLPLESHLPSQQLRAPREDMDSRNGLLGDLSLYLFTYYLFPLPYPRFIFF